MTTDLSAGSLRGLALVLSSPNAIHALTLDQRTRDTFMGATDAYDTKQKFVPYTVGDTLSKPSSTTYAGYLSGTSLPVGLTYASAFFNGEDGSTSQDRFLPLNSETYDRFVKSLYQAFLAKKIPGAVSFDQPSYDDVKKIIDSNQARLVHMTRFSDKTGTSALKPDNATLYGLKSTKPKQRGVNEIASELGTNRPGFRNDIAVAGLPIAR
jgi:hypothetical protein